VPLKNKPQRGFMKPRNSEPTQKESKNNTSIETFRFKKEEKILAYTLFSNYFSFPPPFVFPMPIQHIILSYFDGHVAESKKQIYSTHYTLFEAGNKPYYNSLALSVLLKHVIKGEQKQAEAIIKNDCTLLFKSGTITDLSGNTFVDYSPCQLACYGHDTDMLKMMKSYVAQIEDGEKKFTDILKEAIKEFDKQAPYDFSQLIAAINDKNDKAITKAFDKFKKDFQPRVIKNKKLFNIEHLGKAYILFAEDAFNDNLWTKEQLSLFLTNCIGYLHRSLGEASSYAQALCAGLNNAFPHCKPLKRSLKLRDGSSFFPSDPTEKRGLGYTFAIFPRENKAEQQSISERDGRGIAITILRNVYKTKKAAFRELIQPQKIILGTKFSK
jgi:hypothetical protein